MDGFKGFQYHPDAMNESDLIWVQLKTPKGPLSIGWGERGLTRITLNEGHPNTGQPKAKFDKFLGDLDDYLSGKKVRFKVPFDLSGHTPFREQVLRACAEIPYGRTVSYGDLAFEIGKPQAARAVGQAMAHNTIPIVIPCHRVLSSNGIGGFMQHCSEGLEWKRYLLGLEGVRVQAGLP
ncbi:MAG: MGMT family protein [Candidatus Omnitrophica bacterium]|nr:MGMT family protein [Candidatus Omnitrophota bacterium]MCA9426743.1 MGMT family protein [Candidatus Omnitrophota bacterium]MCB9767735.1 MGMT family protein [Candidatus Omnitrophota bacterium]